MPRRDYTLAEDTIIREAYTRGDKDAAIGLFLGRPPISVRNRRRFLGAIRAPLKPGLPNGCIVDEPDGHYGLRTWWIDIQGYVCGTTTAEERLAGFGRQARLHRLILRPTVGLVTDHINRNKMDNRRANLRSIPQSENARNNGLRSNCSSGYRGVRWCNVHNTWRAYGSVNGKQYHIGYFKDPHTAGAAAKAWRISNMPGAVD